MPTQSSKISSFRSLHKSSAPFIIPNPWDAGSARALQAIGYKALATTSSGFAMTRGRHDYGMTRDEVLRHCESITAAVDIPVSADLENGFGRGPDDTAETIRLAIQTGLAGGSIEDSTGDPANPVFEESLAVERMIAAVEVAKSAGNGFVVTARAEALLYGSTDIDQIIRRLQKFSDAGADVLFSPGLATIADVKMVCESVNKPVNVLIYGDLAKYSIGDIGRAGGTRISVGGALAQSAYCAMIEQASAMHKNNAFDGASSDPKAKAVLETALT